MTESEIKRQRRRALLWAWFIHNWGKPHQTKSLCAVVCAPPAGVIFGIWVCHDSTGSCWHRRALDLTEECFPVQQRWRQIGKSLMMRCRLELGRCLVRIKLVGLMSGWYDARVKWAVAVWTRRSADCSTYCFSILAAYNTISIQFTYCLLISHWTLSCLCSLSHFILTLKCMCVCVSVCVKQIALPPQPPPLQLCTIVIW